MQKYESEKRERIGKITQYENGKILHDLARVIKSNYLMNKSDENNLVPDRNQKLFFCNSYENEISFTKLYCICCLGAELYLIYSTSSIVQN